MMEAHIPTFDLAVMGTRFREERAHWKDDELSECLLLTAGDIADLEAGKINPDAFLLFRIAASGLDVQYILTGIRSLNWFQVTAELNRFDEMEKASGHYAEVFDAIQTSSPKTLEAFRNLLVEAVEKGWSLVQFRTALQIALSDPNAGEPS